MPAERAPAAPVQRPSVRLGPSEVQELKAEITGLREELTELKRQLIVVKAKLDNHESWIMKRSGAVTSFCKEDGTLGAFNGQSKSCAPYGCDGEWGSCFSSCTSRAQCADNASCAPEGYCFIP